MSVKDIGLFFRPRSIAVTDAGRCPGSGRIGSGARVLENLVAGGYPGKIYPVVPDTVRDLLPDAPGLETYVDIDSLPAAPDLAIVCSPASGMVSVAEALGRKGARAVLLLSDLDRMTTRDRHDSLAALARVRERHGFHVMGPGSLGLMVPAAKLNASIACTPAAPGRVALLSQSNSVFSAVLDRAAADGVGFSVAASLGPEIVDVDTADLLDYLGTDIHTRAVLLHVRTVRDARRFLSATRAAARGKPVLVLKTRGAWEAREADRGAGEARLRLAEIHPDDVYDAAFRRAGMLRMEGIAELFEAVETLARMRPLEGDRLAVLANGFGPAGLACDEFVRGEGRFPRLSAETVSRLQGLASPESAADPALARGLVVLPGDSDGSCYAQAAGALLADPAVDALLVLHAPRAEVDGIEVASRVAEVARPARPMVLASWLGRSAEAGARRFFAEAKVPSFDAPDHAVRAFLHQVRFQRNQELLMQTPPSVPLDYFPDPETVEMVVGYARDQGREWLTEMETKVILAAYNLPIAKTFTTLTPDQAADQAELFGFPVVLKIRSPDILDKSEVGGVEMDLESADEVRQAALRMQARVAELCPGARVEGFVVQAMARRRGGLELFAGAVADPVFGPVLLFGRGGPGGRVLGEKAVGLPPLNLHLAREMAGRTVVGRLLAGEPAARDAVSRTLMKISQLVIDVPDIAELVIDPLIASSEEGALVLDARMRIKRRDVQAGRWAPPAIRPYPSELEEGTWTKTGRRVLLRPIRPEDEPALAAFFQRFDPEDLRLRFFGRVVEFSHLDLARFTQIDYDREMSFVSLLAGRGEGEGGEGEAEMLGTVTALADPDNAKAEFAILVRSDLKGEGLGNILTEKVIRYCRERDLGELWAEVLRENKPMLALARRHGFSARTHPEDSELMEIVLHLA